MNELELIDQIGEDIATLSADDQFELAESKHLTLSSDAMTANESSKIQFEIWETYEAQTKLLKQTREADPRSSPECPPEGLPSRLEIRT